MKLRVTFKTTDAVTTALDQVFYGKDESEYEATSIAIGEFVKYGEEVVIEFDTDARTATVMKRGR